ncbi:hypothetical protein [Gemmatimonas sp.]|uniref:hypothetical protein n=1 Tax=Gemmatimonas sp. TaxID=1962908 RepID=UPI0037BE8CF7
MPRPNWLSRVALACTAVVFVLLVGASIADRRLPPMPPSAQGTATSGALLRATVRSPTVNRGAPIDRASTHLIPTTRAAWQRSGGRRTQRTSSSQISSVDRTPEPVNGYGYDRSGDARAMTRLPVFRRDGRLGSAPTRAPPHHR